MSTGAIHEQFEALAPARMLPDRLFGIALSCGFAILGCSPLIHGRPLRRWALVVAFLLFSAALLRPSLLHPLATGWQRAAHVLNGALMIVLMGLLFFVVITPIGIVRRLWLNDPFRLCFDPQAPTYWASRQPPGPAPEQMVHPY